MNINFSDNLIKNSHINAEFILNKNKFNDFVGNKNNLNLTKTLEEKFNACFLKMIMQSMRKVDQSMKSDFFENSKMDKFKDIFLDQLALNFSKSLNFKMTSLL